MRRRRSRKARGAARSAAAVSQVLQDLRLQVSAARADATASRNKLRTSDAKAAREWRGMLADSQAENVTAIKHLREAQSDVRARDNRLAKLIAEGVDMQKQLLLLEEKAKEMHAEMRVAAEGKAAAERERDALARSINAEKQRVLREARTEWRESLGTEREQMEAMVEEAEAGAAMATERAEKWYSELRNS